MYKVLVFLENQIHAIEETLNSMPNWEIAETWKTTTRIVFVMKKSPKVGRPAKNIETHEE